MDWISLEEKIPEQNEIVLACDFLNDFVSLGRMTEEDGEEFFTFMAIDSIEIDTVATHWMPLPEPPENIARS